MELAPNSKLAFRLDATHAHYLYFKAMHVLAIRSTQKGGRVCSRYLAWSSTKRHVFGVVLNETSCIWRGPQRNVMCLGRRKLASCSLVQRQIVNETGVQL